VVILSGARLKLCPHFLAELVVVGLEHGLIYLPIILENVTGNAMLVGKLGDPVLPHDAAVVLKGFDKRGGGGRHHLKTFILGKLPASLVVYALIQLA
jgi:hypothetical protein